MLRYYILCRNEPSAGEMYRSIAESTDDAHRENRSAVTRHALHMIALGDDAGNMFLMVPVDPQFRGIIWIVDLLAHQRPTEPQEHEGHIWHRFGPLNEKDTERLLSATFFFFANSCSSWIPVASIKPNTDKRTNKDGISKKSTASQAKRRLRHS